MERKRKTIITRPLPPENIRQFAKDITLHDWSDVLNTEDIDIKVNNFHTYIRSLLNKHFPEKTVRISSLDKGWMSPKVKIAHRKMQRAYFRQGKSSRWRKLKKAYKKLKHRRIKTYYSDFVCDLKKSNPGRWYQQAKKIGAVGQQTDGDILVEELQGLDNKNSAQKIAEYFASVSNEYSPVDHSQLPCYLPRPASMQLEEYQVYEKIKNQKNTKSTLPIDIPDKLRKMFAAELTTPLTSILNQCLKQQYYPEQWQYEWVTPVPKVTHPKILKDLRKIACTSDYNKLFEGFLKDWLLEDIGKNMDLGQFGGQAGTGTEHMIVCLINRILYLLDRHPDKSAVIAAFIDWASAFDRQDPTLSIQKFISIGVRPSLIPILVSYLSKRKMKVKFNGAESESLSLVGGGPQGSLIGQIMYLVQSNDNADMVAPEDRFKYIDDLSVLQIVSLAGILSSYNFKLHVASDIGVDQLYLSPSNYETQSTLDSITSWTNHNLMMLNEAKSNYMIFSRSEENFATRLKLNNAKLDRISVTKLLGVWISEDLSWEKNTKEICIKAFSRLSMITKLKYVGVPTEDLLDIYILFIRSCTEYCAVAFHSSLTQDQTIQLERIQKVCLKVILDVNYVDYDSALEMCGLESLFSRREKRCLDFALKCTKHPINKRLFPLNQNQAENNKVRSREKYDVTFARTGAYKNSAIPYCQRLLNKHCEVK